MKPVKTLLTGLTLGVSLAAMASVASATELKMGVAALATSVDPHFHRAGFNFDLRENTSDALVYSNGVSGKVEARLASSWTNESDTEWVFTLNSNATFPNGNALGADDVIYSLCRVRNVANSPGLYTSFIGSVKNVIDAGDGKVAIETDGPAPILLRNLSNIGIVENPTGTTLTFDTETCGNDNWLDTTEFNNGNIAAGIGHYNVTTFTPDVEIILERNESYYGTAAAYDKVTIKSLPDNSARIAALLGGAVDVINAVPINGVENIQAADTFDIVTTPSTLLIFLLADQEQEPTPKVSGTDDKNPFKDVRVRRALNLAIDRNEIAETVMGGFANPASQIVVEGISGHNPSLGVYEHDPDEAKKLLAEAGYPNGFKFTLNAPSDRYVNGPQVAQAVVSMLSKVGLEVELETFPKSIYFQQANEFQYSLYMAGAAADTGEGSSILINLAGTRDSSKGSGGANRGRYSNPVTDDLLAEARATLDDAKREELIQAASKQARMDEGHVPLYHELGAWAARKDVHFEGNANLLNIYYTARPK